VKVYAELVKRVDKSHDTSVDYKHFAAALKAAASDNSPANAPANAKVSGSSRRGGGAATATATTTAAWAVDLKLDLTGLAAKGGSLLL
jgi:hypothetical protein